MTSVGYLVTFYNKEPYLQAVLEGLDAQVGDFERQFVFVDDGSTDGTVDALRNLTESWKNVVILTQDNQGPARALNKGLQYIKADYLKPVDGDDVLPSYATSLLLSGLRHYPGSSLAFGNQQYAGQERLSEDSCLDKEVCWQVVHNPLLKSLKRAQILSPSAWLAKTSLVKDVGGCDEDLFVQDYSLELRLGQKGAFVKTQTPVYISPPQAPGRLSESVGQTLHDLNMALAHLCRDYDIPKDLRRRIYGRAASRSFNWVKRRSGSWTVKAKSFARLVNSKIKRDPTWLDIADTGKSFRKTCSVRSYETYP